MKRNKTLNVLFHALGLSCIFSSLLLSFYIFIRLFLFKYVELEEPNVFITALEILCAGFGLFYFLEYNWFKFIRGYRRE